ncbi:hypothetical protein NT05LI_3711 [Listeria ivanovii FSL F6-596]|nr:hypothetical protein NT05LI_3711 [Listeria ivanovii FSL F6-596]
MITPSKSNNTPFKAIVIKLFLSKLPPHFARFFLNY